MRPFNRICFASIVCAALATLVAPAPLAHAQTACEADVARNGVVDAADVEALLSAWGPCAGCAADVDADGAVGAADLAAVLESWGAACEPLPWGAVLEYAPNPSVVTSAALREAISATGLPWRVRHSATQIEMLLVPPGTFEMGCSASDLTECAPDEVPSRAVTLTKPFYLGRYEVTQAQWTARMGSNPSDFQSASAQVPLSQVPNRPVEQVSWNRIKIFLEATELRLPKEAEWEFAYRAGTTTDFHSMPGFPNGTDDVSQVANIGWLGTNAEEETHPVGSKAANALGLHDMAGNVFEWVESRFTDTYEPSSPPTVFRVMRGGAWNCGEFYLRSSVRLPSLPSISGNTTGFRVARTP